jgi:hypothetical protein
MPISSGVREAGGRSGARRRALVLALAALFALSCTTEGGRRPVLETGPGAETSPDGLHRLDYSGFANAWVRADAPFSAYGTIVLAEPLVAYERTPHRYMSNYGVDPNFPLSDSQMATLKRYFRESFEEEFARSDHFRLVDEPGPDTLHVVPAIVDLVVLVPTRSRPSTNQTFSQQFAYMTLLLEVRDPRSEEVLVRVADRQAARPPGSNLTTSLSWSNGVNDAAAYRHTFRGWARALRQRLDEAHAAQSAWSTAR